MFGSSEEEKGYILNKEAAQSEIKKIFDYLEIDIDEIEDKTLKRQIKDGYGRLIKAVRLGRLEIKTTNGFQVIQHLRNDPQKQNSLVFKAPGAIAKKAMGEKLMTDANGRIYALMGSACGPGGEGIDKLE